MPRITREKIEALIGNPDPAKKCLARMSIAQALGVSHQSLYGFAERNDLLWLIPRGELDHGVIKRACARGARSAETIAMRLSSPQYKYDADKIRAYMKQHGMVFPPPVEKPKKKRLTIASRAVAMVPWPTKINHAGKEFPRGSTEIRRCRTLRESRLAQLKYA
jgi:hypothetical protein